MGDKCEAQRTSSTERPKPPLLSTSGSALTGEPLCPCGEKASGEAQEGLGCEGWEGSFREEKAKACRDSYLTHPLPQALQAGKGCHYKDV